VNDARNVRRRRRTDHHGQLTKAISGHRGGGSPQTAEYSLDADPWSGSSATLRTSRYARILQIFSRSQQPHAGGYPKPSRRIADDQGLYCTDMPLLDSSGRAFKTVTEKTIHATGSRFCLYTASDNVYSPSPAQRLPRCEDIGNQLEVTAATLPALAYLVKSGRMCHVLGGSTAARRRCIPDEGLSCGKTVPSLRWRLSSPAARRAASAVKGIYFAGSRPLSLEPST
jgi:hypothetical protein